MDYGYQLCPKRVHNTLIIKIFSLTLVLLYVIVISTRKKFDYQTTLKDNNFFIKSQQLDFGIIE